MNDEKKGPAFYVFFPLVMALVGGDAIYYVCRLSRTPPANSIMNAVFFGLVVLLFGWIMGSVGQAMERYDQKEKEREREKKERWKEEDRINRRW